MKAKGRLAIQVHTLSACAVALEYTPDLDYVRAETLLFARFATHLYGLCGRDRQFAVASEWFLSAAPELWQLVDGGSRIHLETMWTGADVRTFEALWQWQAEEGALLESRFTVKRRGFGWLSWLGWPIAGEALSAILALFVFLAQRHREDRPFVAGLVAVANGLGRAHLRREVRPWGQARLAKRLAQTATFEANNAGIQARFYGQ